MMGSVARFDKIIKDDAQDGIESERGNRGEREKKNDCCLHKCHDLLSFILEKHLNYLNLDRSCTEIVRKPNSINKKKKEKLK